MPAGDRTGPEGYGARTGRGAGDCAGVHMPGHANAMPGGGMGVGWGGGRGWGHGTGRCWGRGRAACGPAPSWGGPVAHPWNPPSATHERTYLKDQAQDLKHQLDAIQQRLDELDES